nr:hypothetical protein [uncultured Enterobacter sp.]
MAYQTGAAANLSELIEKLATFSQGLGWTVNAFKSGDNPELYLKNGDDFWSFGVAKLNVTKSYCIAGNSSYDSSKAFNDQPDSSTRAIAKIVSNSYLGAGTSEIIEGMFLTYDFFGTDEYLHVAVQIAANKFRHFGIGRLNKEGHFSGGAYGFGSTLTVGSKGSTGSNNCYPFSSVRYANDYFMSFVRADDIGGVATPGWYCFGGSGGAGCAAIGLSGNIPNSSGNNDHPDTLRVMTSQSAMSATLAPVPNSIYACGIDGLWRRLGVVPDMQICTMTGITPRQRFEINGETWMIIPPFEYVETTSASGSYTWGYAYRVTE